MTLDDYRPEGGTAMYDGIGRMIATIGDRVDPLQYVSHALIVILTDGAENASRCFNKDEIFEQIAFRRNACNWQFLFIGSGEDVYQAGLALGIQRSNIVEFGAGPSGIAKIMSALAAAIRAYQLGDRNFALLLKNG